MEARDGLWKLCRIYDYGNKCTVVHRKVALRVFGAILKERSLLGKGSAAVEQLRVLQVILNLSRTIKE
jgi:hypothetical protein